MTDPCLWCQLVESRHYTVYEEPAFVVLKPSAQHGVGRLTLVPTDHVGAVTELKPPEMAAVLAGLSRASSSLRRQTGSRGVEIRARSEAARPGHAHLHFDWVLA
jgi:diadenosine tetraphosphate (Ap4A) HIT family hydrolase